MRQTAHYYHGIQNVNLDIYRDQHDDEIMQIIMTDAEGHHSKIAIFFNGEAVVSGDIRQREVR